MKIPRKILHDGRTLPALGLGTWLMGGDTERIESPQDLIDISVIQKSIEMGLTHIDTAESYGDGHAEELIATAINNVDRKDIFLASKVKKGNHTKPLLLNSLDKSLKRLGTDYLDLYYLHQPTLETPFEETAEALNLAYQSGKIRNVGVCNFSIKNVEALQKYLEPKILVNQVHYNLAFREPDVSGLLHHSETNDYFIMAWRPLKLIRRSVHPSTIQHNIWERGVFPVLDKLADKYEVSNVQIALAWVTFTSQVVTLVKSSNINHLNELIDTFSFKLSNEDYLDLTHNFEPKFDKSDSIPLI